MVFRMMASVLLYRFYYLHFVSDSNTQSSDVYTLSTNSGSENSKASSSDTSPALRNSGNQSRLSTSSRPTSERNSNANPKCVSEGSVSPLGHSSYSATTAADVCADNQTVINLGNLCVIVLSCLVYQRSWYVLCQWQGVGNVETETYYENWSSWLKIFGLEVNEQRTDHLIDLKLNQLSLAKKKKKIPDKFYLENDNCLIFHLFSVMRQYESVPVL